MVPLIPIYSLSTYFTHFTCFITISLLLIVSLAKRMNDTTPQASTLASLYIEALRQKQPLWFRVASNSMLPLLRKDDSVYIEPAQAEDIRIGDIAAFETSSGLVIHRIVAIEQTQETIRLL